VDQAEAVAVQAVQVQFHFRKEAQQSAQARLDHHKTWAEA
jgi:hypothetical protein